MYPFLCSFYSFSHRFVYHHLTFLSFLDYLFISSVSVYLSCFVCLFLSLSIYYSPVSYFLKFRSFSLLFRPIFLHVFPQRLPGFDPRPSHERSVMDNVALSQTFSESPPFSPSNSYSTNYCTYINRPTIDAT
jgi:hypothetical protein